MTNEQIRRELSYGIGSQNIEELQFTVTEQSYGHGGIPQTWDKVVLELFTWPHCRQKLASL